MDIRSKKTPLFLAKDLELIFFETAPAHEIIKYVDLITRYQLTGDDRKRVPYFDWTGRYWSCSKEIESTLANRNDPNIDIALVRIADYAIDDILEKYLKIYEDKNDPMSNADKNLPKIILSAVQNPQALTALGGMATWLKKAWHWIVKNGDSEHYYALFKNPNVPDELIENILNGVYDGIVNNKYWMYGYAMKCPTTRRGLDGQQHGPDFAAIHRLEAYWNFIAKMDVKDQALRQSVTDNSEKHLPYQIELKDEDFGFPKYGTPGYNRDENYINYLKIFIGNWLKNNESDAADKEQREYFVEFVCSVFVWNSHSEKVTNFLKNHELQAVRRGFYRGKSFSDKSIPELEGYAEKEGYEFLWSAIENGSMYNFRDNKELCFWFFNKINYARLDQTLIGTYDEKFPMDSRYKFKMNSRHKAGRKTPSLETISFKNFERKFDEWKEGKRESTEHIITLPTQIRKTKPELPEYDKNREVFGEFKLKTINVSNRLSIRGFEKALSFYASLEDSVILEHLKQANLEANILAKINGSVAIHMEEYHPKEVGCPDSSFCGRYTLHVHHGINTFSAQIFCTDHDQEIYSTHIASEPTANKFKNTIFYLSMLPDPDFQSDLSLDTSKRYFKQSGNIVSWSITQDFNLNL